MSETIKVSDKIFKPYLSQEKILTEVERIAEQMNKDLEGKNPLLICVLNGAFIFAADLYRRLTIPSQITFMRMKSYVGTETTGAVKTISNLLESVVDRTVVIVEDIVDSGYTMQRMIQQLKELGAKDVRVAVLLNKPKARKVEGLNIDYCCLEIPNDFIVGYGLDYNEEGRNLPDIYVVNN